MATLYDLDLTWDSLDMVARLKTQHTFPLALFGYCAFIAEKKYEAETKNRFWLSGIVYSICASFGGGIIVPVIINDIPFPMKHDLAIPAVILAWFLTRRVPAWRTFVNTFPTKLLFGTSQHLTFVIIVLYFVYILYQMSELTPKSHYRLTGALFELMHCTVILNWTRAGQKQIHMPSWFGGGNIFGPIMCGTIAGCGGAFWFTGRGTSQLFKHYYFVTFVIIVLNVKTNPKITSSTDRPRPAPPQGPGLGPLLEHSLRVPLRGVLPHRDHPLRRRPRRLLHVLRDLPGHHALDDADEPRPVGAQGGGAEGEVAAQDARQQEAQLRERVLQYVS